MSEQTFKLIDALTRVGFDSDLADTVAKRIFGEPSTTEPANKADLNEVKTEIRVITARLNMLTALNVAIFASILIELVIR